MERHGRRRNPKDVGHIGGACAAGEEGGDPCFGWGQAEQIDQTAPQTVVTEVKAESLSAINTAKTELLHDLQQQLKDSISQQATSALSHVVQTVKAMLP